ncbi:MAG: hypothetical protein K2N21_05450, partial [Rikenellaceae bacterium]|nr:hypothetical protein [Rikenellaceae bacterium]
SNSVEFPAVGNRGADGSLGVAGALGSYWSSVLYDSNLAYRLSFSSSGVNPQGSNGKRFGFSVRCVR